MTLTWKPASSWVIEDNIVYTHFFNENAQRRLMVHLLSTEFELGSRDKSLWTNLLSYEVHCCAVLQKLQKLAVWLRGQKIR